MKEFQEDKNELTKSIKKLIIQFQDKYDVKVEEIELDNHTEDFYSYLEIKIKVEL